MEDRNKDKEQLQNELMGLCKKIDELEHIKATQKQTEKKFLSFPVSSLLSMPMM